MTEQGLFEIVAERATLTSALKLELRAGRQVRNFDAIDLQVLRAGHEGIERLVMTAHVTRQGFSDGFRREVTSTELRENRFSWQFGLDGRGISRIEHCVLQHHLAEIFCHPHFGERGHHHGNAAALIGPKLFENVNDLQATPWLADRRVFHL